MLMIYDLELDSVISSIKKEKARVVMLQFSDGLKPDATSIAKQLEEATDAKIVIWLDSCYGSCDYPILRDVDLLVQFGHTGPAETMPNPTDF